ncbi:MAG: hypothetical protein Tsb0020_49070 [Haliangiales bacterium]
MRILVVDSSAHLAQRLCATLADIGHDSIVATTAARAIELARTAHIDGVLVDLDLPGMNGVEFAETLWLYERYLPIGFRCSAADHALTAMAADIGALFPIDWRFDDIIRITASWSDALGARQQAEPRLAEGSDVSLPAMKGWPSDDPALAAGAHGDDPALAADEHRDGHARPDAHAHDGADAVPNYLLATEQSGPTPSDISWVVMPTHKVVHRLSVVCRRWDHVAKLCEHHDAGRNYLVVRGLSQLSVGEHLVVALDLPSGLRLSLDAAVRAIRIEGASQRRCVIDLVGMNRDVCAFLREAIHRATSSRTAANSTSPTRSQPSTDDASAPDTLGWPLRSQIDRLANRLGHRVLSSPAIIPTPAEPEPAQRAASSVSQTTIPLPRRGYS